MVALSGQRAVPRRSARSTSQSELDMLSTARACCSSTPPAPQRRRPGARNSARRDSRCWTRIPMDSAMLPAATRSGSTERLTQPWGHPVLAAGRCRLLNPTSPGGSPLRLLCPSWAPRKRGGRWMRPARLPGRGRPAPPQRRRSADYAKAVCRLHQPDGVDPADSAASCAEGHAGRRPGRVHDLDVTRRGPPLST